MLARDQLGQVAPALRGCAVQLDLVDAEVGVRAVAEPDRGRRPAHLLHGDAMLQVAEPAAAFLLIHGDAEQAEVAQPRPEVARELVARVDLLRARRDLGLREALDRRADHVRRLAKPEIQAGHSVGSHFSADSLSSISPRLSWGGDHSTVSDEDGMLVAQYAIGAHYRRPQVTLSLTRLSVHISLHTANSKRMTRRTTEEDARKAIGN